MAKCKELRACNIKKFIDSFDTVLTDCDGVLWNGPDHIDGAQESFKLLRNLGKRIFPVTNNSTNSREQYAEKCEKLGFHCERDDIVGSGYVTAQYIKDMMKYNGKIFMLGSPGLYRELCQAGFQVLALNKGIANGFEHLSDGANLEIKDMAKLDLDPAVKCVVVGFDRDLNYLKLTLATSFLSTPGCKFVATNTDAGLPMGPGRFLPGTGAIVAAVAAAAGREPDIICGKPSEHMFEVVQERTHIDKERTIMIGDRLNTDILLAHNCGLRSLHVGTGVHSLEDAQKYMSSNSIDDQKLVPDYFLPSFGCIAKLYKEAEDKK